MPNRSVAARANGRGVSLRVATVLLTLGERSLNVLLLRPPAATLRDRWTLPVGTVRKGETVDDVALRIARDAIGVPPSHLEQAGALGGAGRGSQEPAITLAYVGLVPGGTPAPAGSAWTPLADAALLAPRHRDQIDRSVSAIRARIDQQPIAFRLLPEVFTLSELQAVYEMLLGQRLHKASFRRSLHAAAIVEATDEWRSEGRGRPAQLFRYAPPRRRRQRRGVRFDRLG